MPNWSIRSLAAAGIAGAAVLDAVINPLHAQVLSSGGAIEHIELEVRTTRVMLGALSGSTSVRPTFLARDEAATEVRRSGPGAYTMLERRVALNNNQGPDDYFAPTYRDGRCVEDEGNTLVAEPKLGGGIRRMEGKSLLRALAALCRQAAIQ